MAQEPDGAAARPDGPAEPPVLRRAVDALGGARGTLLASLPTVGFVVGNEAGGLGVGAISGTTVALLVLLERLRSRQRPLPAVGGFVAVVALVALALRSGSPSTFFLPAVVTLLLQSAALLGAAALRRPVSGHVSALLAAVPEGWRADQRLLRLFVQQDLVWSVVFVLRSAVTAAFVLHGSVTGAGLFRLTGTPMYVALVALCVRWARPVVLRTPQPLPAGESAESTRSPG
jgi:hypothetical protein